MSSLLWIVMFTQLVQASVPGCPNNLSNTTTVRAYRKWCYQFVDKEKYRTFASSYCHEYGGSLVTIDNEDTYDYITSVIDTLVNWRNKSIWVGVYDKGSEWVQNNTKYISNPLDVLSQCDWLKNPCRGLWRYRFICQYDMVEDETSFEDIRTHLVWNSVVILGTIGAGSLLVVIVVIVHIAKKRSCRDPNNDGNMEDNIVIPILSGNEALDTGVNNESHLTQKLQLSDAYLTCEARSPENSGTSSDEIQGAKILIHQELGIKGNLCYLTVDGSKEDKVKSLDESTSDPDSWDMTSGGYEVPYDTHIYEEIR